MASNVDRSVTTSVPVERDTQKILQSMLQHSRELVALGEAPAEDVARMLGIGTDKRHMAQKVETLNFLSRAFARVAASLQESEATALLETARKRGDIIRNELVDRKQVVPSGEITRALCITRQALNKALKSHRMFAVEAGGQSYYPTFFADPNLDRRKVQRVARALGDLGGWEKWLFFTTPKSSLGRRTPLQAMREGKYEGARLAAAGHAER